MSKLQKISNTHYRVVCDCGEFTHELKEDEKGNIVLTSFKIGGARKTEAPKREDAEPKGERRKKRNLFGSLLEDDEEEEEETE